MFASAVHFQWADGEDPAARIPDRNESRMTLDEFTGILRRPGITLAVDVRASPRSRTAPQFNPGSLPGALACEGLAWPTRPRPRSSRSAWTQGMDFGAR